MAAGEVEDGAISLPMRVQWHDPTGQVRVASGHAADTFGSVQGPSTQAGLYIQGLDESQMGEGTILTPAGLGLIN